MRMLSIPGIALLLSCRPAPMACPSPSQGLVVTQVLLERGTGSHPTDPDFTITFTASGDALYAGSARVPIPGSYMGRIGPERFTGLVNRLLSAGLPVPGSGAPPAEATCGPASTVTLAYQTISGQFAHISVCPGSVEERRLLTPLYQLVEQTRWQPGATILSLGPT